MTAALTGAYGHPIVQTPNMNRLCADGVRFDRAYTNCPICAPARAAMIAGCYTSTIGTYDNGSNFPADIPTLAHFLRDNDYEVMVSGKMHFIGPDQLHGIEQRLTTDIYPSSFAWYADWSQDDPRNGAKKGTLPKYTGVYKWGTQLTYDEETHFQALQYLRTRETAGDEQKPFCLIVSYTHPHSPYLTTQKYFDLYPEIDLPRVSKEDVAEVDNIMDKWLYTCGGIPDDLNDDETITRMRKSYYGMITYVDEKMGELLDNLENIGIKDDTAIFMTADHGDMMGERGLIEKRVFYDHSARVPLICSYPKLWRQGAACTEPVSLIDIFPTIADLIGEEVPIPIDGRSFYQYLEDDQFSDPDRVAISEYHCEGVRAPCFMIVWDKYKLIYVDDDNMQLFDLINDPDELHNCSNDEKYASTIQKMRQILLDRFDFDAIHKDVLAKQQRALYINQAMKKGEKISWDYSPPYHADTKYLRSN